jgi:AcrR family transcriptional regulator
MPPAAAETDLRERVIDASVALIDEKGLAGLSMREVARRAGVSHQAPYHYFADREAILAAVCERGFGMLHERIAAARTGCRSAGEQLERAALAYVGFAREQPAYFRMMFRPELVEHKKHELVVKSAEGAFQMLPEMVLECVREGLPIEPGVDALVMMTWSFVHGLACLLVDGSLEKEVIEKGVPRTVHNRDGLARDAIRAFRGLVDAAIESGRKEQARKKAKAKPKAREVRRSPKRRAS